MDVPTISNGVSGQALSNVQLSAGLAVMAKSLDNTELQGQMLTQMMERSVQPHLGGNLDIRL
ncbi:hypothetical protein Back11_41230 [Paenibacillus baekrokdamisoli]|uniref:Uncharacterized protein n=1 Tax=Paenibacillus baekrokdamisoli TaxID=1712516 RepID=A0A3G9JFF3_9BACL|nr:YjfB family protein [Paenibacillus baekrokdamisoli]MBB3068177.1 hypothetical protein [Paenibacillus baekrokdamisoli]BBH22778.1 hypothetical protein Back11_41230 [Paenibacillus baekrokdamisoli]